MTERRLILIILVLVVLVLLQFGKAHCSLGALSAGILPAC